MKISVPFINIRFLILPWDEDEGLIFTLKELGFYVALG